MASVFKPTFLRPIPAGAVPCKLHDAPAVRYTDQRGRVHVRPIHRDRAGNLTDRMECSQSHWWMRWTFPTGEERREKGFRDRVATEQEASRREREAQLVASGMQAVDSAHLAAPILAHVEAYIADLERAGRAEGYYTLADTRLRKLASACQWQTIRSLSADELRAFLRDLAAAGASPKTCNDYLATAKSFAAWLVRNRRAAGNPFSAVSPTEKKFKTYERRPLMVEEARRLLAVAGPRRLLYLTAMYTGLRRSELRALEWQDIRAGATVPTPHLALRAQTTKARRADTVPLRRNLAAELLASMPANATPTDRVFPAVPKMATFKRDLRRAGIAQVDAGGRVVDLHSLRGTLATWLAEGQAAPRTVMEVMRHASMNMTMQVYAQPQIRNVAAAVEDLPDLTSPAGADSAAMRKTGTDDIPNSPQPTLLTKSTSASVQTGAQLAGMGQANHEKTPVNQGFFIGAAGFEPATS